MNAPALELRGLTVGYGGGPVISGLDLTVSPGETLALLGPSGSGKSTLLYAVAGLLEPRAGTIALGGAAVAGDGAWVTPERRSVGMVFQHGALWPHMTAVETVAYPMRRRGMGRREALTEAGELLDRLGLRMLADRRPAELSGGEQQRVGLCRALARRARLYLFDEPTAHLDVPLRQGLADELAEQRERTGAAAVYATHDLTEALALADRVAVLREGGLAQVGTPLQVYEQPADRWVAALSGPVSILDAELQHLAGDRSLARLCGAALELSVPAPSGDHAAVQLLVRPDWASLGGPLSGHVSAVRYRGWHTDYRLATPCGVVTISERGAPSHGHGDEVGWSLHRAWPLPD